MKFEKEPGQPVTITNCNFEAKVWDDKAVEAINTVAKALLNLTELFKSQNITIESMVKFETKLVDKTKDED